MEREKGWDRWWYSWDLMRENRGGMRVTKREKEETREALGDYRHDFM